MRIEFPLLSILSVAFLLFFALQGGQVELYSLDVGFSADSEHATMTIDPTLIVWWNSDAWPGFAGMTYGNVVILASYLKEPEWSIQKKWIEQFELNHVMQFHALGWWVYPALYVLPIDPKPRHADMNDFNQPDRIEWLPPEDWLGQWRFIDITIYKLAIQ